MAQIPETLTGQGVLHGIQNDGSAMTITGYGTFVLSKVSGTHTFELKTLKDETDFTAALAAVDEGNEIEIDFTISSGVGGTRAQAAALAVYPSPIAKITLAHNKLQGTFGTSAGKLFDGDFVYMGGAKIDESGSDWVKLTGLKLKKWANVAQNTSLTTVVTG
jgi:hypothetical protein